MNIRMMVKLQTDRKEFPLLDSIGILAYRIYVGDDLLISKTVCGCGYWWMGSVGMGRCE
jgi:hypothetical protein